MYNLNLRLPFFKFQINNSHYMVCFFFILLWAVCVIGYLLNFQNLWQYWPDFNSISSMADAMDLISFRFVISLIGIFISPIGIITGYVW